MSLTTAAVILAAYAPNEVILADAPSSEDALRISDKEKVVADKEKVVADKETENNEQSEELHNVIETSKDTEEKKTTVIEEKRVVSKKVCDRQKTSNEGASIKEDSNQSQGK